MQPDHLGLPVTIKDRLGLASSIDPKIIAADV